ncbi:MAG: beta-galactosidase domain 4-containing protein [Bacteroidota bacterium]
MISKLEKKDFDRELDRWPDKPLLLCEYTHAMGNGNGNLDAYWDKVYSNPRIAGLFVWDWMDQGIRQEIPYGKLDPWGDEIFFAYGGWWEERANVYHDDNFCMNGLIDANWQPHPGLVALKHYQQPITGKLVEIKGKSVLEITNRLDFTNVDEVFDITWELLENGVLIGSGVFDLPKVTPHQTVNISLPKVVVEVSGKERMLSLSYQTKQASAFWEKGYELGWDQFKISGDWTMPDWKTSTSVAVEISDNETQITFTGTDWEMLFDKKMGRLLTWNKNDIALIERGGQPDFWRAPTDNDRGAGLGTPKAHQSYNRALTESNDWKDEGVKWKPNSIDIKELSGEVQQLSFSGPLLDGKAMLQINYDIYPNGDLKVDFLYSAAEDLAILPRVGMEWILPLEFDQFEWYGPGPLPTYSDRNVEKVGIYTSTAMDNWVDYSKPQENGNKAEVRWVKVRNEQGNGLQITSNQLFNFNLMPYGKKVITDTKYSWQLPQSERIYMNIDHRQLGVGGDNSWGAICLPEYQLKAKEYKYSYYMRPTGFENSNSSSVNLNQK